MSHFLGVAVHDGRTLNQTTGLDLTPRVGSLGGPIGGGDPDAEIGPTLNDALVGRFSPQERRSGGSRSASAGHD